MPLPPANTQLTAVEPPALLGPADLVLRARVVDPAAVLGHALDLLRLGQVLVGVGAEVLHPGVVEGLDLVGVDAVAAERLRGEEALQLLQLEHDDLRLVEGLAGPF